MRDPMGLPHRLSERDPAGNLLSLASRSMAISGGLLFIVLIGMSLVSIIGRKLGFGSVNGDIELMQAGTAVGAVSFLPYCTLLNEHIKVDFFTEGLRPRIKNVIDGLADFLIAAVAMLLAWRTTLAALALHDDGEVTALVLLPLWIPTIALVPGLSLTALCALYRGYDAFRPARSQPESGQ